MYIHVSLITRTSVLTCMTCRKLMLGHFKRIRAGWVKIWVKLKMGFSHKNSTCQGVFLDADLKLFVKRLI